MGIFELHLINLGGLSFGPSVKAAYAPGLGSSEARNHTPTASALQIPWHDVQSVPDPMSLISWHTQLSRFVGRHQEIESLLKWLESPVRVSIKLITGDGGTGKSRLAAEFGRLIRQERWTSGFANLSKDVAYPIGEAGALLIVDYPEEKLGAVRLLLEDLRGLETERKIRVLLLSRKPASEWDGLFNETRSINLIDKSDLKLGDLVGEPAYVAFTSAMERASELLNTVAMPLSTNAFNEWQQLAPENRKPLFISAAAAYGALYPEDPLVTFSGRHIVSVLVEREIGRLAREAHELKLPENTLSLLIVTASVLGSIDDPTALFLYGLMPQFHQISFDAWHERVMSSTVSGRGPIQTSWPDIVVAAFVAATLGKNQGLAVLWVRALFLIQDTNLTVERLIRFAHDMNMTLGIHETHIDHWLLEAVKRFPAISGNIFHSVDQRKQIPTPLLPAMREILSNFRADVNEKGVEVARLTELATIDYQSGVAHRAVETIGKAVDLAREYNVAEDNEESRGVLAECLIACSTIMADVGELERGLADASEAVNLARELQGIEPERFNRLLAQALNAHSNRLIEVGSKEESIRTARSALEIRREQSRTGNARQRFELSQSLNNLANRLREEGEFEEAQSLIEEAVQIRKLLASEDPVRYEHHYARSQMNLCLVLASKRELAKALEAATESLKIYRRAFVAYPSKYREQIIWALSSLQSVADSYENAKEKISVLDLIIDALGSPFVDRRIGEKNTIMFACVAGPLLDLKIDAGEIQDAWKIYGLFNQMRANYEDSLHILELWAQANRHLSTAVCDGAEYKEAKELYADLSATIVARSNPGERLVQNLPRAATNLIIAFGKANRIDDAEDTFLDVMSRGKSWCAHSGYREALLRMAHNMVVAYFDCQDWERALDASTSVREMGSGCSGEPEFVEFHAVNCCMLICTLANLHDFDAIHEPYQQLQGLYCELPGNEVISTQFGICTAHLSAAFAGVGQHDIANGILRAGRDAVLSESYQRNLKDLVGDEDAQDLIDFFESVLGSRDD